VNTLNDSERYTPALFGEHPLPMWIIDESSLRFLEVNESALIHYGYTREEFNSMTIRDIRPAEDIAKLNLLISGSPDRGEVGEWRHKKKDGTIINVVVNTVPMTYGAVPARIVLVIDITELRKTDEALRKENEKNIALLHNASDGIHILDTAGNLIEASDSFCSMLGYTRDELIGINVAQWDAGFANAKELMAAVRQEFNSKTRSEFETRHRRKDGTIIDVQVSGMPLLLDGKPVLFNSSRDISDRKRIESALKQQLLFANAINSLSKTLLAEKNSPELILENAVRIIGEVLGADRALIYNVALEERKVIGRSEWLNPQYPDTASSIAVYPLSVFMGGVIKMWRSRIWFCSQRDAINPCLLEDGSGELLHRKMRIQSLLWYPFAFRTDGFYVLVLNQIHTHKEWAKAETDFLDSVSQLITIEFEKMRLIAESSESEKKLRIAATAFESREGMMITDAHSMILQINQSFAAITGYSAEEVIGKNPNMFSSGRHDADFYASMWASINQSGSWEGEIWNRRKNGEIYPEYMTITSVKDKNGIVTNYVAALTDSSERHTTLEQLRTGASELALANAQVEEERAQLAARVEERTTQLQYANHAKDSFLATMSHEIRTPLGGLMGMMELLSLSELDAKQQELLDAARSSGKSLLRIVNDILDWSKIEAGKLELAPQVASIHETLKSVAKTYLQLTAEKDIQLKIKIDPDLSSPHLYDPLRLSQILNNFTSNALKFTERGTIEISAQRLDMQTCSEQVRFSVKDTGIGIDPAHRLRLFQHYEQASADTARMYGGTGLGLAISRRLAELMGGNLSVESALGVGSTFSFTVNLPVASLTAKRNLQMLRTASPETEPSTSRLVKGGQHVSILVVDDHPINRMLLQQQLDLLGLHVEAAESGMPALALWQRSHFDLIITDCHMPEMDGYELTRRIRASEQQTGAKRIPIIAWTANVLAEEELRCRDAGMDDMLTKPTELSDLRAKLLQWLVNANLSFGDTTDSAQASEESRVVIDFGVLKKFVAGRAAQVEMLQIFNEQNRLDIAILQTTLKEGDPAEVAQAAHRIKGASRMVGAVELEGICARIEKAARQEDMQSVKSEVEQMLDQAVARVEASVDRFINMQ